MRVDFSSPVVCKASPMGLSRAKAKSIDSVKNLLGVLDFGNNVYSSVGKLGFIPLTALRDIGIKKIVDLENCHGYKELVEDWDLEYVLCHIDDEGGDGIFNHPIFGHHIAPMFGFYKDKFLDKIERFGSERTNRMFVEDFVKLIGCIREGNCFITRSYRNGLFVNGHELEMLENCFNPDSISTKKYVHPEDYWRKVKILYNNFTENDKKVMGWTKDFEQKVIAKLENH